MINKLLVIAAGRGSRLNHLTSSTPKPLMEVCGLTLIERLLLTAKKAGITEFHIVVGYEREKLKDFLQSRNIVQKINFIDNEEWEKSNGVSVLKAKKYMGSNSFLLSMCDHIFQPDNFSMLIKQEPRLSEYKSILAVDSKYKSKPWIDLDDATKVRLSQNNIEAIGKQITPYDALDTGLFLCTPAVFDYLEKAYKEKNDCSLSEGMTCLIQEKKLSYMDVGNNYWCDVDTATDIRNAEGVLLRSCKKSTDGLISRNFNRYVSTAISRYLCKTSLTPNQISVAVFGVGIASFFFLISRSYWMFLIGLLLFKFTSILDGCDGEIAKLKFQASKLGAWMDTVCDNLTNLLFIIAISILNFRTAPTGLSLTLGVISSSMYLFSAVIMMFIMGRAGMSGSLVNINEEFKKGGLRSFLAQLVKRDFFTVFFILLALLEWYSVILVCSLIATAVASFYSVKKFKQS